MKWKDIKETYKDQWVLIEVKEVDRYLNVSEGEVIAHSKDKEDVVKKLLELNPRKFSIDYTGEVPEDLAVVLVIYQ